MNILLFLLLFSVPLIGKEYFSPPTAIESMQDKSLEQLLQMEKDGKNTVDVYFNIAINFKNKSNYNKSKEYFFKAIGLDKGNSFLSGELGKLYNQTGMKDSAQFYFEKALELNYENLDIWNEITKIAPLYFFNLGILYRDKAKEFNTSELARKAIDYLKQYEQKVPDGEMIRESQSARAELELLLKDLEAKERRKKYEDAQKAEEQRKSESIKMSQISFRTSQPYIVGLWIRSYSPFKTFTFISKDPNAVVEDTLKVKQSLSEISFSFGMLKGPLLVRGYISSWSSAVHKQFLKAYNDTYPPDNPMHYIYSDLAEIKTFRFGGEGLYNVFFKAPLILYTGVGADYASYTPSDKENLFESQSGVQLGWDIDMMLYFNNLTVDLGYFLGIIGDKTGGSLNIGLGYKF